jgi:glyoxylase-like metal-dependent hydrolase (beta-lactamase superfamily II)/rhodanese-related sulfurtransferase
LPGPTTTLFRELNRGQCKTYLLACGETRRAVLIDPLKDRVDRYLAVLAYHRCTLDLVVDTHTHADHRTGVWDLHDLAGARVVMHRRAPAPHVDVHVDDGARLTVGSLAIGVLHTPGHTPDGISLHVVDRVFTGDTLLIHGTGRADFAGGDAGAQWDSIVGKLFTLPDETLVFPAHDYRGHTQSSIGEEKRGNPRLAGRSREAYVALMQGLALPLPDKIQEALQANQSAIEDAEVHFPPLSELNRVRQLTPREVHARLVGPTPPVLLDVREPDEYRGELGHVPGSVPIPLPELAARATELAPFKDRDVVAICRAGVRSTTAAAILTGLGFEHVSNLKGGMLDWNEEKLPVER